MGCRKVYDVSEPKNAYLSVLKSYGWWWVELDYSVSSLLKFLFSFVKESLTIKRVNK